MESKLHIRTHFPENGRIVIPANMRKALGVSANDEIIITLEEGSISIHKPIDKIVQIQKMIASCVPEGISLSEELIKERREESKKDD